VRARESFVGGVEKKGLNGAQFFGGKLQMQNERLTTKAAEERGEEREES
jgi:hypothetical protein